MGDDQGMPFIGSTISLVSKKGIRYEGVLCSINMEESSIALKNVRSFGTEGRPTDAPVPGSTQIYEYVMFRGQDIQDLTVLTQPAAPPPPVPNDPAILSAGSSLPAPYGPPGGGMPPPPPVPGLYQGGPWGPPPPPGQPGGSLFSPYGSSQWAVTPPAGAVSGGPPTGGVQLSGPPAAPHPPTATPAPNVAPTVTLTPAGAVAFPNARDIPGPTAPLLATVPTANGSAVPAPPRVAPSTYANAAGTGRGGGRAGRGGGGGGAGGGGRGAGLGRTGSAGANAAAGTGPRAGGAVAAPTALTVPDEDYDFEGALKKFDKDKVAEEAAAAIKAKPSAYTKDDFFDSMSCEALERQRLGDNSATSAPQNTVVGGGRSHIGRSMAEQRRVDIETFGGLGGMRHHYHHRGGRGGRGRGGGGGGYRGGGGGGGGGGRGGYRGGGGGGRGGPRPS